MRLIVEIEFGGPHGHTETIPMEYPSKEQFLLDFEAAWNDTEIEDAYLLNTFEVGGKEFYQEHHTFAKFTKANHPKFLDYADASVFDFSIIFPEVYTVDEWFDK